MSESNDGRWVWHDLMTTDPENSKPFFSELYGWDIKTMEDFGGYDMIHAGEKGIGGFEKLDPDAGVPSHWMGYAGVDDVAACVERATTNGGSNPVPPKVIPSVGTFAVIRDPHGATFAAFQSMNEGAAPDAMPGTGEFCWNELLTNDTADALRFYGEVIGWGSREMDMGPMGTYHILTSGGQDRGGIMAIPEGAPFPPNWLHYVAVENVDNAFAKANDLGASALVGPTDIPDKGRFAVLTGPTGACFGIFAGNAPPAE